MYKVDYIVLDGKKVKIFKKIKKEQKAGNNNETKIFIKKTKQVFI